MCFSSESTVKNEPSEEQSQAFKFRMGAAQQALNQFLPPGSEGQPPEAGTAFFANPQNSPYKITQPMQQAITGVQNAANNLPPDPTSNWALQAYGPGAQQYWNTAQAGPVTDQWNQGATGLANALMQNSPASMNDWMTYAQGGAALANSPLNVGGIDMGAADVNFTPESTNYAPVGVGEMDPVRVARIDPTGAINAAQHQLSTISSPAIRNALQAAGLGRSGAEAEGLAQEGVRLELPIQQQILQSEAQANQLEAQIKAHQEEVQLLEQQKAKLQAQQLTAASETVKQQLGAQIAGIEAQIRGNLAAAQFAGQTQAAIAQRTSALQYASSSLGQLGAMNTAQYQTGAQVGTSLLGQLAGMNTAGYQGQVQAGGTILNDLAKMGLTMPALQSQQYQNQLTGAQTNLQAASLPQQMQQQEYLNYQNYVLSLLGATPLPGQSPGGVVQQSSSPSGAQLLGTGAMIGSMFV